MWHILDAGSIWMQEFSSALSGLVPTMGWVPKMSLLGALEEWELEETLPNPPLRLRRFPLQRGYSRFPVSLVAGLGRRVTRRLHRVSATSPLVCTTPFYAPVAERWKGPVIYYLTDLAVAYAGLNPRLVRACDRRLCRVATLVCPNSRRIADYLRGDAGCSASKIAVIANATRESNVLSAPAETPAPLPADVANLPRPILGVLGNLAANMNWTLLLELIQRTPQCSWLFVGPTEMHIHDAAERRARRQVINLGGRVRFAGAKPYGSLRDYARAFDVAVLPYRRHEPTFSGSCTRFYEHLAACRPMLATRGFEELLHKQDYLDLFDTAAEFATAVTRLEHAGFRDGREGLRWEASRRETWEMRARAMRDALGERLNANVARGSSAADEVTYAI